MATVKYLDENGLSTVWSKVKGIVTPKADKVSGATNGHLAGLNSSGNLTDSGLAATNIAQKDGSYSGMTVGAAEDLVSAESVASEFTSRITGGSTAVGKGGTALVDKIKGRTLVWNQRVKNGNFASSTNNWAAGVASTSISVSNGVLRVSVISGTNISNMCASQDINTITDHKYLIRYKLKNHTNTGDYYVGYLSAPTQWIGSISLPNQDTETTASFILTANNNRTRIMFGLYRGSSAGTSYFEVGDYVDYSNITCIDLTLMFGAGNEPTTAAAFEALYPLPYYEYDAGTLISNAATAIETVGWNIFTTENITTGYAVSASNGTLIVSSTVSATDYLPVIPEKEYYLNGAFLIGSSAYGVSFYDGNKNYISGQVSPSITAGSILRTPPAGARYMRATVRNNSIQDAFIGLSDTSRNGTYEPHWRSELELNIPTLTGKLNGAGSSVVIFPDGMNGYNDSLHDKLWATKAQKVLYKVKLGDLTWRSRTASSRPYYFAEIANLKEATQNLLFSSWPYIWATYASSSGSYTTLSLAGGDPGIYVYNDSTYSTADAFKESIADVWLVYEIATPEEYILDEAIPTAMRNDPYGTERRLPEDTAAIVTAPFRADITYSTNIKEAVQSLPQNYINVNSMQDFLAALGAQMGGTWTMRPADGKFDFTFTPNPSNE